MSFTQFGSVVRSGSATLRSTRSSHGGETTLSSVYFTVRTAPQPEAIAEMQDSSNVIPICRPNGAPVVRGGATSEKTSPASSSESKKNQALDWSGDRI
jgi:hypothetical protein